MALDSVHPKYQDMRPDWDKMRDVYKGERHVKDKGKEYLPPTKGMLLDGYGTGILTNGVNLGQEAYDAYKLRAVLPDYVKDAVDVFIGLLHSQPATIELPDVMEPLRERITMQGESIELLLRRMNEEQLVTGRLGLLLDLPKNPDPAKPMPYIALYITEAIRNWDDGEIEEGEAQVNMVVLDESGYRRNEFEWTAVTKYRVLQLGALQEPGTTAASLRYSVGVFEVEGGGTPTYVESDLIEPTLRGQVLDVIPFVFVNTKDIVATPDDPPLLGLANACLTIYRGEADYRQNLFLQGQDTLVVKGDIKRASDPNELAATDTGPIRTGTGAMIHLEGGADSDAKYIGVNSKGLPEQRTALENDRRRAEAKSSALSSDTGSTNSAESGAALKTRVGARTASLNQIAKTGAAALETLLKIAAKWMGADPEKVKVTPNLEFADFQMTGQNLAQIMAAKAAGAPLSNESIHELMAEGGLTKLDYPAEKELLDAEAAATPPAGTTAGGNPDPNNPDNLPADPNAQQGAKQQPGA